MKIVRIMSYFLPGFLIFLQTGCNTRKDEPPPVAPNDSLRKVVKLK